MKTQNQIKMESIKFKSDQIQSNNYDHKAIPERRTEEEEEEERQQHSLEEEEEEEVLPLKKKCQTS